MLYQFNVAQLKYAKKAPQMSSFFRAVPHLQRFAEASPGFVWRKTDEDDPTIANRLSTDSIVNLPAWQNLNALYGFVFNQSHRAIMMARDHWFTDAGKPLSVVRSANNKSHPAWDEAIDRLNML